MSEFVEVEWFGRNQKIGIVLTYDEHDGFKCRMAPLPEFLVNAGEMLGVQWMMDNAAKIPFEWAWGIFAPRIRREQVNRDLVGDNLNVIRYDGRNYDVVRHEEVK